MKKISFCVVLGLLFMTSVSFGALKDPTRPVEYSGPTDSSGRQELEVSAILISKHRKMAIINGQSLLVGEKVGEAEIMAIEPNSVTFKTLEGDLTVILYETLEEQEAGVTTRGTKND